LRGRLIQQLQNPLVGRLRIDRLLAGPQLILQPFKALVGIAMPPPACYRRRPLVNYRRLGAYSRQIKTSVGDLFSIARAVEQRSDAGCWRSSRAAQSAPKR
jgi:hypothetical protein